MVARISDALSAYATSATQSTAPGMEARDRLPGASFGDMVRDMVTEAAETGRVSEDVSQDALVGKADLNDVVMAVSNAEVSLQTVVAIRDKVIEAYQEILRMPI